MSFDAREAAGLHARVQRVIERGFSSGETFDELARAIASFQARNSPGYARLCAAHGVDPSKASTDPRSLPAVPTDAFRVTRVATFPESEGHVVFHTSGTTERTQGRHAMRTLDTYRAASLTWARRTLFAPYRERPRVLAIAQTDEQAPHSSLARMMRWFVDEIGDERSRFLPPDAPDAINELARSLREANGPVVVLATAFAYVHLVDADFAHALPRESRAMQTGGFKGRSREIAPNVLRRSIAAMFHLPIENVVGEYGMTELTSQLYAVDDSSAATEGSSGTSGRWIYRAPPWVRVVATDPTSLTPLRDGEEGIARIEDLGNVESAWAIQTADRVRVLPEGVDLLGRLPGAAPRGCSLAVEELLAGSS